MQRSLQINLNRSSTVSSRHLNIFVPIAIDIEQCSLHTGAGTILTVSCKGDINTVHIYVPRPPAPLPPIYIMPRPSTGPPAYNQHACMALWTHGGLYTSLIAVQICEKGPSHRSYYSMPCSNAIHSSQALGISSERACSSSVRV